MFYLMKKRVVMLLPLRQIRLFVADGNEVIRVTCKLKEKVKQLFNEETGGRVASTRTDTAFCCRW